MTTLGYRTWRLATPTSRASRFWASAPVRRGGGLLYPITAVGGPWLPGVNVARCTRGVTEAHLADLGVADPEGNVYERAKILRGYRDQLRPIPGCTCGLYAYATHERAGGTVSSYVGGLVLLTGRIIEYEQDGKVTGWRAERGRILALVHVQPDRLAEALHPEYAPIPIVGSWDETKPIRERWSD